MKSNLTCSFHYLVAGSTVSLARDKKVVLHHI